ncbi:ABC transporter permease [Dictyobacter alpinus]|uniref:ABC transporter permease n=1 Tax=Dictyobacter alpinus TaxID=2014873 RepID=A0A402B7S0_9CHLR|nr:ABC transporter permease [Dictyobacter alpinus]GCE27396.1 ABC transporter permease [Dictyobacter alpinus]
MTFLSLLTKEMRLRLRRERTIWVIISYILLLGLLGWTFLSKTNSDYTGVSNNQLSNTGSSLFSLLAQVQLLLIVFITPSLTTTAINGEKERQTYEMLICSRLSPLSLIMGKLGAGLLNALLLVAASLPLFSLVFFFGGVGPAQIANALLIFIVTILWLGAMGIFCSALIIKPAVSTGLAYLVSLFWVLFPLLISWILSFSGRGYYIFQLYPNKARLLYIWNPIVAISCVMPNSISGISAISLFQGFSYGATYSSGTDPLSPITLGGWHLTYVAAYLFISAAIALLFLALSILLITPRRHRQRRHQLTPQPEKTTATI